MKRLLFVIPSLGSGGAERQMVELIKGLDKNKYTISVLYFESKNNYRAALEASGIDLFFFERKGKYDISIINRTARLIKEKGIDVVHSFLTMGSLVGVLASRLAGRPVVCSAIRDGKDVSWKRKLVVYMLSYMSDVFVSNSKAGFSSRFRKMRNHFRVIYNGADARRFCNLNEVARLVKDELQLDRFDHVVGMVASLSANKDQETFLLAAKNILVEKPNTGFLVVGDGAKRQSLELLSEQYGISNNVIFTGYRKDVESIIACLDVSVLLTNDISHAEGIPNAMLESMFIGIPVLASYGGGTGELIRDGLTGILVKPGSVQDVVAGVVALLNDKTLGLNMARNAKEYVSREFSNEKFISTHACIYDSL